MHVVDVCVCVCVFYPTHSSVKFMLHVMLIAELRLLRPFVLSFVAMKLIRHSGCHVSHCGVFCCVADGLRKFNANVLAAVLNTI